MTISRVLAFMVAFAPAIAGAQHQPGQPTPYAGFETRAIKALSESDLDELRRGGGWGLALSAELNGIPGPAHLLELREELALSTAQVTALQSILEEMRADAIEAGSRLIAAEEAIEAAFRADDLDDARLRTLVAEAEAARAELRFVHLSRHLSTPPLLSAEQIARYNVLRGYGADPCASVPDGHNPEMWRRHNGCQ